MGIINCIGMGAGGTFIVQLLSGQSIRATCCQRDSYYVHNGTNGHRATSLDITGVSVILLSMKESLYFSPTGSNVAQNAHHLKLVPRRPQKVLSH